MSWLHEKTTELLGRVQQVKALNAFPYFRPMENIGTQVKIGDGSYINFTSNDYLGLSQHPMLIDRAIQGIRRYGTGLGSARPQATSVRHNELERRLARWLEYPACATFTTGHQVLVGTLQAFLDDDVTVVLDKLDHAAIMDGVMVAQGQHPDMEVRFFKHNDVESLEKTLSTANNDKKMVVIEGLYSVDGDVAPLDQMLKVARKYGAVLLLDDAHGLGTLGPTGRGVAEQHRLLGEVDLLMGTFSKSFGTVGGFLCADQELIEYIKLSARSFVYSATLPLAQVEAAMAALDIMEQDLSRLKQLQDNGEYFRTSLHQLGFSTGDSTTHITPIFLNEEILTMKFAAYLYHGAGIIMVPFVAPGVPKGKERLRCNVTAGHSKAQMGYTLEALAKIGSMLGALPQNTKTRASALQKAAWLLETKVSGLRNAGLPYLRRELKGALSSALGREPQA